METEAQEAKKEILLQKVFDLLKSYFQYKLLFNKPEVISKRNLIKLLKENLPEYSMQEVLESINTLFTMKILFSDEIDNQGVCAFSDQIRELYLNEIRVIQKDITIQP